MKLFEGFGYLEKKTYVLPYTRGHGCDIARSVMGRYWQHKKKKKKGTHGLSRGWEEWEETKIVWNVFLS